MARLSPEKSDSLKRGFLFFILSTLVLTVQFFFYLKESYLASSMDATGWTYYVLSAAGHAFLISCLPFFFVYLPVTLFTRMARTAMAILVTLCLLLNLTASLNGIIFKLYKFHINGFVIDMVFGAHAGQIFVFHASLIWKCIGFVFIAATLALSAVLLSRRARRIVTLRRAVASCSCLLLCVVFSHIGHAYAAVKGISSIENAALCLPQFYPLTANRMLLKLGVVAKDDFTTDRADKSHPSVVNYPIHPLVTLDSVAHKDIIVLMIDSWNPQSFDAETTPNIHHFAQQSQHYTHHLSSSNGTRGGLFGCFFGLSPVYWKYFEIAGTQPLLIDRLLQLDYDIQIFASATLVNPPFYRVLFRDVPKLRTETPGDTPFDRDERITSDFLTYLDSANLGSAQTKKTLFAYLFYDLPHAIDLPHDYPRRFSPAWDYADYTRLNNDTDPVPYFNLYRNCVWHTDSLIGCVLKKWEACGRLKNSIVIITGDHGQEFNENKKGFWGHNGNFSDAQIRVPLIYYNSGIPPAEIAHPTTHYDIVPTLMHDVLGVTNPPDDYCMGRPLDDSLRLPFHIAGSFDNYAIITDSVIYEKKTAGRLVITDRQLNTYNGRPDAPLLQEAMRFKNRFLKE